MPEPARTTAADIHEALRGLFAAPEWMLAFEVRNAAGFNASRAIDAQAVNTWPSRGMEIVAVEIKVSRGDFLREMKAPAKVEEGATYADKIALAAPRGMVQPAELPKGWGLIEVNGAGKGRWKVQADRKTAKPIDRAMLVTMLRSLNGDFNGEVERRIAATKRELQDSVQKRIDREAKRLAESNDEFNRRHADIYTWLREQGFSEWCGDDEIKAAVQIARHAGLGGAGKYSAHGLTDLHRKLSGINERLAEAMAEHGIEA